VRVSEELRIAGEKCVGCTSQF